MEIQSVSDTTASKDNISTIVDNKFGKYINDSSNYYTSFPAKEKTNTISSNIHKESDNYYDVSTLQGIKNLLYFP